MTLLHPKVDPSIDGPDVEALIREARHLRRRRWFIGLLAIVVAGAASGIGYSLAANRGTTPRRPGKLTGSSTRVGSATGAFVSPSKPFALAMAPNGDLYVSDPGRQEILRGLPNGKFQVAVGTGVAGSSGDGGPATRARIDVPSSLAVTPNGTLYFVQQGPSGPASELRAVAPNGKITTVIGAHPNCDAAGASSSKLPAADASFGGAALAIGPNGNLYLSTIVCGNSLNAGPLMELTPSDELANASASPVLAEYGDCGGSGIAFGSGAVYAACDSGGVETGHPHGKELLVVEPDGATKQYPGVYPYDDPSGFVTAPNGTVIAIDYAKVVRVSPAGVQTVVNLGTTRSLGTTTIEGRTFDTTMEPNGIAVDSHGNIYLASTSGFGNGLYTGIIEVHPNGRIQVLWHRSAKAS